MPTFDRAGIAEDLDMLETRPDGQNPKFQDAVARLRGAMANVESLELEPDYELPWDRTGDVSQGINEVRRAIQALKQLDDRSDQAQLVNCQNLVLQCSKSLIEISRPMIRGNSQELADNRKTIADAAARVHEASSGAQEASTRATLASSEAEEIVATLRGLAGEAAGDALARFFDEQANDHKKSARNYIIALGLATIAALAFGLILILTLPDSTSVTAAQEVKDAVSRVVILGVVFFVVSFCARNYRTHKHVEIVSRSKSRALQTYGAFSKSVEPGDRAVLTAEAAHAVFASPDTGLVGATASSDSTDLPGVAAILASHTKA